jgi:hypothetical protein
MTQTAVKIPLSAAAETVPLPANLPNKDEASENVDVSLRPMPFTTVVFYIDADNQSAASINDLVAVFGAQSVRFAAVAGNNHGAKVESWSKALQSVCPDIIVTARHVSSKKEAADISLIMELGANLERHLRDQERIVIVSRDELLIGTGEQLMERGCPTMIAYAYCDNPPPRPTRLVTLLLPGHHKPAQAVAQNSELNVAPLSGIAAKTTTATAQSDQKSELAKLRNLLSPKPGGGYGATEVGQALSKMGYKSKSERAIFLKSVSGLTERGTGPNKVLVF